VAQGARLGGMSRPLQMQFLAADVDVDRLPPTRAEVAFIGRSNVGKSSLLNAIAAQKVLAPVSKHPGRTQTLGCFKLDRGNATLVDCPGYGYAKVAKETRAGWLPMLERYLLEREPLVMVLLLVDGEIGPTASDLLMLGWLREHQLPHTVIATKHDKVKPSQRDKRQREFAGACKLALEEVLWVSAAENMGIGELREAIREWLA
jgi:GTP-binding protein